MPEHNPLVSILVNNYNYEDLVGEAIDSTLAQTYPNTEVIVVDDGSTDDSRAVISAYKERVVAVCKENGGQASAFNAGFAASSGEIVLFLDADDYLFPEAVERIVKVWKAGTASVQYRLRKVDASGGHLGYLPEYGRRMDRGEVWRTLLDKGYSTAPVTSGLSFGREVLGRLLPMPEEGWHISADGYLITLAPFHGRVEAIEEPLGAYRLHGSNLWAHQNNATNDEALLALKFRKAVQHDLDKHELLVRQAREIGHSVPSNLSLRNYGNLQFRMALTHLDPDNLPVPADRPPKLAYWGLRAVWRYSGLPLTRRLKLGAWFLWTGLLPKWAARPAVAWLLNLKPPPREEGRTRRVIRYLSNISRSKS